MKGRAVMTRWLPLCLGAWLGGCASGGVAKVESAVDQSMSQGQPGYQLAMQAVGCWAGWLWAEAEGYLPPERRAVTEVRCRQVLRKAFGDGQDRYQRMRDMEPALVDELANKVGAGASGEERELLVRLLRAAADAEREAREARQAARTVRKDLNDPKDLMQLDAKEAELLKDLHAHAALERLMRADLGPLTEDARVIGLLLMVGRVERVRLLPQHLRPHAIEGMAEILFGQGLPELDEDMSKPLSQEAAIRYLVELARRAGYAVPDSVTQPAARGLLSFTGILKALADRIREADGRLSKNAAPTLRPIAAAVSSRLDQEYASAQQAAASPGARQAPPASPQRR